MVKVDITGYLNLKKRNPPMTTKEKHATRSTNKNLHNVNSSWFSHYDTIL